MTTHLISVVEQKFFSDSDLEYQAICGTCGWHGHCYPSPDYAFGEADHHMEVVDTARVQPGIVAHQPLASEVQTRGGGMSGGTKTLLGVLGVLAAAYFLGGCDLIAGFFLGPDSGFGPFQLTGAGR